MPEIVIARSADHYRRLARERVEGLDTVLEIGCSTGVTTRILAGRCRQVVAVDVSWEFLERARSHLVGLHNVVLACVDGRDTGALVELVTQPDAAFIDVGGNAPIGNAASVAWHCLRYVKPRRLVVVRNAALTVFAARITGIEAAALRPQDHSERRLPAVDSLIELSRSSEANNRVFAVRRLRHLDSADARERLRELALDAHARVRHIATTALAERNESGTLPEPDSGLPQPAESLDCDAAGE